VGVLFHLKSNIAMDWARSHGAASGCYPTRLTSGEGDIGAKVTPGIATVNVTYRTL
jgi:hypothetical protein